MWGKAGLTEFVRLLIRVNFPLGPRCCSKTEWGEGFDGEGKTVVVNGQRRCCIFWGLGGGWPNRESGVSKGKGSHSQEGGKQVKWCYRRCHQHATIAAFVDPGHVGNGGPQKKKKRCARNACLCLEFGPKEKEGEGNILTFFESAIKGCPWEANPSDRRGAVMRM